MTKKLKILAVIVNYGLEQLIFLEQMVSSLRSFKNYDVTIIVHSNSELHLSGIDEVKLYELENYRFLPATCRNTIWEARNNYDLFFYSENDMLIQEKHFDNFLTYTKILPKNRIAGLLRYEMEKDKKFYPDFHGIFEWNYKSVEKFGGKTFAHFTNLHQACLLLTKEQLDRVGNRFDFTSLVKDKVPLYYNIKRKLRYWVGLKTKKYYIYDEMCKVGTDVYKYGGMKRVICISEFEENLIHHMSDVYIDGSKGRKKLHSDGNRMNEALKKMIVKE